MELYNWYRAFHVISFVAWFAGLFYIWRLFVYAVETGHRETRDQLMIMAEKLHRIIMRPAMIATLVTGSLLLYARWDIFYDKGWLWVKVAALTVLFHNHFLSERYRHRIEAGEAFRSKRFRILNEVPTLVLFVVAIMVLVKPF